MPKYTWSEPSATRLQQAIVRSVGLAAVVALIWSKGIRVVVAGLITLTVRWLWDDYRLRRLSAQRRRECARR